MDLHEAMFYLSWASILWEGSVGLIILLLHLDFVTAHFHRASVELFCRRPGDFETVVRR